MAFILMLFLQENLSSYTTMAVLLAALKVEAGQ